MLKTKCLLVLFITAMAFAVGWKLPVVADDTISGVAPVLNIGVVDTLPGKKPALSSPSVGGGFLAPVNRLQEEVAKLEQRLAKLTVPLDQLQPGTVALDKDMTDIKAQTAELLHQLNGTRADIASLQTEITTLRQPIAELKLPVMQLGGPVANLQGPITQLRDPLKKVSDGVWKLETPLVHVYSSVNALGGRFSKLDGRFSELDGRFAALDGRFTGLDHRFVVLDGRFLRLDGRFVALDDRFVRLDDRFAALGGQLAGLQVVLYWLLAVAALSVFLGIIFAFALMRTIAGWQRQTLPLPTAGLRHHQAMESDLKRHI